MGKATTKSKGRKCWFIDSDTGVCQIRVCGAGGPCRFNGKSYDRKEDPCKEFYRQDPYTVAPTIKATDYVDVRDIPIERLIESDQNPREHYDQDELDGMAADMKARGQEQNLVVRPHPDLENHRDDFEIAFGSRRYRSAKIAKLKKLKCYVKDMGDKDFTLSMSMENHWHVPLTPLEQAKSIKNLVDAGYSHGDIAKFFSKSGPWVTNILRLSGAPDEVKELMNSGHLTVRHVIRLMPFAEYPIMNRIIDAVNYSIERDGSISSRHMESIIPNTILHNIYDDEVTVLNIDIFPSSIPLGKDHVKGKVLDKYFDMTECNKGKDGCGDIHVVQDDQDREARYCLNRRCWKDKVNLAKQQHDKALEDLQKKAEEKESKKKKKGDTKTKEEKEKETKDQVKEFLKDQKKKTRMSMEKFSKYTHVPKELRTIPEVEAAGETFPENGNEPACIKDVPKDLGFSWKINRTFKYVNCPVCKEAIQQVMKEQRAKDKQRKAEERKKKEELRLKEEERLRKAREQAKKRKEKEERDRVVQAFDDYLDSLTDTFSYLDQRDGNDPEIRIWKTILYHDVRHHWRDAVKLAMRRWDPTLKDATKGYKVADKLKGAEIVLAVLRILFFQTVAMHKTMGVTRAKLKKEFPDAAKFYTRGPVEEETEEDGGGE